MKAALLCGSLSRKSLEVHEGRNVCVGGRGRVWGRGKVSRPRHKSRAAVCSLGKSFLEGTGEGDLFVGGPGPRCKMAGPR